MTTYQPNTQQVPSNQVLLVVHQPTLGHRLPRFSSTRAYLNRGAQFSNGCQCFLPQMLLLIVLGSLFTFMGLSILAIGVLAGVVMLMLGGGLLGAGLYLIHTAKKQFNSLPANHPDRTKYACQNMVTDGWTYQTPTMYTMPPMQHHVMGHHSSSGGQVFIMPNPVGAHGSQTQFVTPPQPGRTSPGGTYRPENDPPPAYSDVVHNI
ncbi:hypothetical protein O3P69_013440 [Scylla paramamosain]|uniref:Uncharacterized protein n=3 Tax=Scylla paramamosain TaxID=85552 RepID=A0AAW0S9P8_SCYPA